MALIDIHVHSLSNLEARVSALEQLGAQLMSNQSQVDALVARLIAAVTEVAKDIAELSAKVKAGAPIDTAALDAAVATLEALGLSTDAATVNPDAPADVPPADQV